MNTGYIQLPKTTVARAKAGVKRLGVATEANVLTSDVSTGTAKLNFEAGGHTTASNTISAGVILNEQLDIILNVAANSQIVTPSGIISTGVGDPASGAIAVNITNSTAVVNGLSS